MKHGKVWFVIGLSLFALMGLIGHVSAEPVTIKHLGYLWQPNTVENFNHILQEFNDMRPDVEVEYVAGNWAAQRERLIVGSLIGDVEDIVRMDTNVTMRYAPEGILADLRPYLSEEILNDIPQFWWDMVTGPNGEIYAIPWITAPNLVIYNTDLFAQAGVSPPPLGEAWTFDELAANAQKLRKDTTGDGTIDQWGLTEDWGSGDPHKAVSAALRYSWSAKGSDQHPWFFQRDGEWVVEIDEAAKKGIQFAVDLINEYKIVPIEAVSLRSPELYAGFVLGRYAMITKGAYAIPSLEDIKSEGFAYDMIPPAYDQKRVQVAWAQTFSVLEASEYKQQAVDWLLWLNNVENQAAAALADYSIPTRISSQQLPGFEETEILRRQIEAAQDMHAPPSHLPIYNHLIEEAFGPYLEAALLREISVDEAVSRMEAEGRRILRLYE